MLKLNTLIAFITGLIGFLSFSPYNIWFVPILSFCGLILSLLKVNKLKAMKLSFLWGFSFFGFNISWIYIGINKFYNFNIFINIILIFLLIAYLSLYPILFSIFIMRNYYNTKLHRLIIYIPIYWTFVEYLRSKILIGFPWIDLGYSQINSPLKKIIPIVGLRGITFLLLIFISLITFSFFKKRKIILLNVLILFLFSYYTLLTLKWHILIPENGVNLSIIQGNIVYPIKLKSNYHYLILNTYLRCTLPILNNINTIIWPESTIIKNEILQNKFFTQFDIQLKLFNTNIITGIIDIRPKKNIYNYYNSIILLGKYIKYNYYQLDRYNKYYLVPFGERMPLKNLFILLDKIILFSLINLNKGLYIQYQIYTNKLKFNTMICYEAIFSDKLRDNFKYDTNFLLSISNDYWFGNSIGPWQHHQMMCMRALEFGRYILCNANNGITTITDMHGITQIQLPQFKCMLINSHIIPNKGMTPYSVIGLIPILLIMFLTYFIKFIKFLYLISFKKYVIYIIKNLHI